jgi:hypothetical protein
VVFQSEDDAEREAEEDRRLAEASKIVIETSL